MMRYLSFAIAVLYSGAVFSSEILQDNKDMIFYVNVGTLDSNPLRYCNKNYIDSLKKTYHLPVDYNEPFLMVFHRSWDENVKKQGINRITLMPFKCFVVGENLKENNISFKQKDDILFSFSQLVGQQKQQIQIKLDSNFGGGDPKELLKQFKMQPQCISGDILDKRGDKSAFVETDETEKELCDAGFISRAEGQGYFVQQETKTIKGVWWKHTYAQGINGYFGDEIRTEQKNEEKALFYSHLKKLFVSGSFAAVIMYILYKKFYTTTG